LLSGWSGASSNELKQPFAVSFDQFNTVRFSWHETKEGIVETGETTGNVENNA